MLPKLDCSGCIACCKGDAPHLVPQDRGKYLTDETGKRIRRAPNGDCVYLTTKGCSIYKRRPYVCRQVDCRKFFLSLSQIDRALRIAADPSYEAVFEAARERLPARTCIGG